ncbi:hypothetical protein Q7P35_000969 [Cladosporium inversicolor]
MSKAILYDIPTRGRASCFSHNVWKTRLVFNYKKIPYETVWLEHADIEPTLKSMSAPPRLPPPPPSNSTQLIPSSSAPATLSPTGAQSYTVPTILLPSGTAISDSLSIALWAEIHHPAPSLLLEQTPHALAAQKIASATFPLIPVFMPLIPRHILRPTSIDLFNSARAARFGMPLDELEATRGGEKAWEAAGPGLDALEALMVEHKVDEGPFVLGSQVSYADFVVVAVLEGFRRVGQDLFERIVEGRGALRGVWEACERWLERDD